MSEVVRRGAIAARNEMGKLDPHLMGYTAVVYQNIARAVIESLREPSAAMVAAVRRARPHDMDLTEAWPIAIDEALK